MNIVYNLKKFFAEQQDEAAIPGLGVFFKVATDDTGNPLPGGESVILFVEKTPRSNAFVNFLGYEENLTENEAVEVIEQWVSTILSDLKMTKLANIPELGCFEIKKDKVIFKPAIDQNTVYAAPKEYGLDELPKVKEPKKINQSNEKPPSEKQPMNKAVLWSIIGAIVIILIGVAIVTFDKESFRESFQKGYISARKQTAAPIVNAPAITEIADEIFDEEYFVETPQPAQEQPSEIRSKPEVIQGNQTVTQPARPAQTQPAQATSQLPFAVIGGAFGVKGNADRFATQMRNEGFTVEVIFDRDKQLHLVSLGTFRTMNEALEFKERIRTTKDIACWVFRR